MIKLLLLLSSLGLPLRAAHADLFRGPQSTALGGSGVAGMPGAESGLLNPALIPLFDGSGVDAYYRDGYSDRGRHDTSWGFGAIDNGKDVWFPGTLHYFRSREMGRSDIPADGELWHAAIGQRVDKLAVGVSAYRLSHDLKGDRRYEQWNYSLGAVYQVVENFGVGYVLKNLAGAGSNIPVGLREDLSQTLGLYGNINEIARLRFDVSRRERFNPDKRMAYMFGLESRTSEMLQLRLGYRYDDWANQRFWTAGFGFDGPRLKVDYAFEKAQERTSDALHSVDLRLVF